MRSEFKDNRLYLRRTAEERAPLLKRLARIEGQVRGLQQMIQQDRYCGDELQQMQAVLSAMREVMRMLAAQHVSAGVARAARGGADKDKVMADIALILRAVMRAQ